MFEYLKQLFGLGEYARNFGAVRSSQWPAVREAHLKNEPQCRVCGGTTKIQVHHILPFHLHPELELDPTNLITLCEGNTNINCHLAFGHFGNFQTKWNKDIQTDSQTWLTRFTEKAP